MTDKRQKVTKVKYVNAMDLSQNSQYLWNIVLSRRSLWVLLELISKWTQHFTKINQEKRKIKQICIWNPMITRSIMLTLIYIISMEFLPLSHRSSSAWNVPIGEELGEAAVFTGYETSGDVIKCGLKETKFLHSIIPFVFLYRYFFMHNPKQYLLYE